MRNFLFILRYVSANYCSAREGVVRFLCVNFELKSHTLTKKASIKSRVVLFDDAILEFLICTSVFDYANAFFPLGRRQSLKVCTWSSCTTYFYSQSTLGKELPMK